MNDEGIESHKGALDEGMRGKAEEGVKEGIVFFGVSVSKITHLIGIVLFQNGKESLDDIVAAVNSASSNVPRFVIQSALVVPQFCQLYNRLINHADVFCAVARCMESNSHSFFFFNSMCRIVALWSAI